MNSSLTEFRDKLQELLLTFLWRQWSALGVAGHTESDDPWIVDPEALLLWTSTLGRYDARLFDEVLDWLHKNGSFINTQRLARILREEKLGDERVLSAIAGLMSRGVDLLKWKRLADSHTARTAVKDFFFLKDSKPLPVIGETDPHFLRYGFRRSPLNLREHSQTFRPTARANLILQLRAILGLNARCEIVAYLVTHKEAHPSEIARAAYYHARTMQDTLVDMSRSGVIEARNVGREKLYRLKADPWMTLLNRPTGFPQWVTWPPLFRAFERIWLQFNNPDFLMLDSLLQSSQLRQLMTEVRPFIERAGFAHVLSDDHQYLSESYSSIFLSDITRLLK